MLTVSLNHLLSQLQSDDGIFYDYDLVNRVQVYEILVLSADLWCRAKSFRNSLA